MERNSTMTSRYFADAGVVKGMRVLEVGCGRGEVTEVLAQLVGSSGAVLAVDRDQDALAIAQDRMQAHGNVRFVVVDAAGDLSGLQDLPPGRFDVLAGRRVLMYLRDPADVLRRLSAWVRSRGLVVFEELDATMVPARTSPMRAHDQATEWLREMLVAEGANTAMGFDLPATLARAGFRFQGIRAEAVIQGQGTQFLLSDLLDLVRSRVISAGIATQAEVDALRSELAAESREPTRVYISEMSFCAWARKP